MFILPSTNKKWEMLLSSASVLLMLFVCVDSYSVVYFGRRHPFTVEHHSKYHLNLTHFSSKCAVQPPLSGQQFPPRKYDLSNIIVIIGIWPQRIVASFSVLSAEKVGKHRRKISLLPIFTMWIKFLPSFRRFCSDGEKVNSSTDFQH